MLRSCVVGLALATGLSLQAQTLILHYQDRPPYSSRDGGGDVVGLVATPAARALRQAGIPFAWTLTPSQRQLALIQSGTGMQCGVGWFRNTEREAKGRFSAELYRDRPFGALVRDELPIGASANAFELVNDRRFKPLVKEGYSYGRHLDNLFTGAVRPATRTNVDPPQMARMLLAGRADWMVVAPEEASLLLTAGLRQIEFKDMPVGSTRHLYCSQDVPADWLARINRALLAPSR